MNIFNLTDEEKSTMRAFQKWGHEKRKKFFVDSFGWAPWELEAFESDLDRFEKFEKNSK